MWAIISAGIAPGLALLSYFYLKDEYETEPLSLVLRMFLYGAFLVFPLMFIQHVLKVEHMLPNHFVEAFFINGFIGRIFLNGLCFTMPFMIIGNLMNRMMALCME